MGCDESKDSNFPVLLCFFEVGNEEQKQYCLKLKDNFQHEKAIRFEIKSTPGVPFSIKFKLKGEQNPRNIQDTYDNSEQAMRESLEKMYKMLDESP